jgi:2,5-dihydroxypyridine 5,6-dioxygenase
MMTEGTILLRAAEALLNDLMCLRADEEVLITADPETDPALCRILFAVAERAGARPHISIAPRLPFQGALADPYISAPRAELMRSCDVWIDLTFPYLAGAHAHEEAMKTNRVRYMLCGDLRADNFARLFGMVDWDSYFAFQTAFDAVFTQGSQCRVTDPLGTDVSFTLAKPAIAKPRHMEKPGLYVVPGALSITPDIATVKGEIVVTYGFHEFYAPLASPVRVTVDGPIVKVSGGGATRPPLERALLRAGGGQYGSIIHFSQGMHPAARLTGKCFIEDIRTIGTNAVGLGIPCWLPGGGENHPDAVLTEQSVWVDGEKIIEDGLFVAPSLVDLATEVKPLLI